MNYSQIIPPDHLKPYIRHFGVLEQDDTCAPAKSFKVIADGCPGLIFQENPDCFLNKGTDKLPQIFLHGLTTSYSEKTAAGSYRNIGVYFQPTALKAIFGIDAHELSNGYTDLNTIVRSNIAEQLLQEEDASKRISLLSDFITRQIVANKQANTVVIRAAVQKIKSGDTEQSLQAIRSELNISERSLERLFQTHVGISPKLFWRISRFQQALDQMRKQPLQSLTVLAHQYAYADQSHYAREFKEFSGASPTQFLKNANEQAINFPEWKS